MVSIDIEAIRLEFDRIVAAFGTPNDIFRLQTERFIQENSIILQEVGGGNNIEKVFLTVTTFEDQNDGSYTGGLSLRDAILRAKADSNKEYVIRLPAGVYQLSIQGNEDTLSPATNPNLPGIADDIVIRSGDLDIKTRIRIVGAGANATIINASGLGDRIFDVGEGGLLILEGVTLEEGFANNTTTANGTAGGAIRIQQGGGAIISNSIIRNSSTPLRGEAKGGGIANFGDLELVNTTISGNVTGLGGGVYTTGNFKILNSSLVGNVGSDGGGGIYVGGNASGVILNSTISSNLTEKSGGGILSENATVSVVNTTITKNSAQTGSGIIAVGPDNPLLLQNSIVAGNLESADIEGFFAANSAFNLIGNGNGVMVNGLNGNIVGDVLNTINPRLGPLQNNGGITPTHAPLPDSPAIDRGDNQISSQVGQTDQTGANRIRNRRVDIGSVEAQISPHPLLTSPIYRFQNREIPGTYLFVNESERQRVLANFPQFQEEGFAFSVATREADGLIPIYRFQNREIPGTYLYVNEEERRRILRQFPQFQEEGLAFYVFPGNSTEGETIYRFQNSNLPGTYLFVNEAERLSILQNYPSFIQEGIAFSASLL
ncbi:MAG: hypothetical protein NZ901_05820 [Geminocystis sp.]|nr:hypothetical protein [Geminocystis sp.]MCS7147694.1 hypothetical protein [Geminocystis sp.]MDW8117249.1 choice-of-anchor Q domain-containing protein [Geminocystis sp.]MDW8463833.1 choice-of-anchor Q domain-containing protein [Geminocystis sp.]